MNDSTRDNSKRLAVRRRGSIYAVVLAMAILVSLIGLSAVAVGRINLRAAAGGSDASSAELLAVSAVEHAITVLNSEAGWRGNTAYANEQRTNPIALGDGQFCWKLKDERDHNIAYTAGGIQPVRVYGIGEVGDARRVYSVELVPTGTNLLTNPGFESGLLPYEAEGTCVVEATATDVRNGLRSLMVRSRASNTSGPRQDVMAKIVDGKWYYAEAWVKMSTTEEVATISMVARKSGQTDVPMAAASGQTPQTVKLEWTKIGYAFKANIPGGYDSVYWRITTSSSAQDFQVDDVKLIQETSPGVAMPMAPARETWKQETPD